ncbi:MAG: tetratricopeptide repeat protein [Lewinellaceae bacterium]|nr:tetratricopeptide repeat protein [Lewinellaceae bacterium]
MSYNNLAGLTYGALGEHQKVWNTMKKALAIWGKVLPSDHPDLALSYNNLAETYGALGEHRKRLEYNEKALSIREKCCLRIILIWQILTTTSPGTYRDLGDIKKAVILCGKRWLLGKNLFPQRILIPLSLKKP